MTVNIRLETKEDYREVEELTREAFWDVYKPGCDEHLMVHQLRNSDGFVKDLDYIACIDDKIVGSIIYTEARIINEDHTYTVLCMGPLSVHPDYQKKGIAAKLMNHTIAKAKEMGYRGIILFGSTNYYPRFGFIPADNYGITTSTGDNFDAFMALELHEGSLNNVDGRFYEDEGFSIDEAALAEFEKLFK